MISVILYGRNDSYGYNLHKRAALSLNCIAEVLTGETDEILFVDYNTPDDFPTFPEAIQDTLTPRAKRLLRIPRVRPAQHAAFRTRSQLVALEPVARNVAVRRSNPANRWVLSTNTDMILAPRTGKSLTEIAAGLPDAYYHLPRFEVPEALWESLDRRDAPGAIARIAAWGERFHLNEIVEHHMKALRFDALGDFQLILREDLLRMHGFDERMLLGYHVDSNIAQRLLMLGREPRDILPEMFGFHCDHMRQVTPAHRPGAIENDPIRFIHRIPSFDIPEQAESWGLAGETVEEVRVDGSAPDYASALAAAIPAPMTAPATLALSPASYDAIGYETAHVLPYLLDSLASYPRATRIGWAGCRADLRAAFEIAWAALGFATQPAAPSAQSDVFIFDFGLPAAPAMPAALAEVVTAFRATVAAEQARVAAGGTKRRFITVNAIHNRLDGMVRTHVGVAKSPLATRIRQGFVLRAAGAPIDILPLVSVEEAGSREPQAIRLRRGERGHVFGGPQLDLAPGRYRLTLRLERIRGGRIRPGPLKIAAEAAGRVLARRYLLAHGMFAQDITLSFTVPADLVARETVALVDLPLTSIGYAQGRITRAVLTPV